MSADDAHKILDIYAYFEGGSGHVLLSNHFLAVGGRRGWTAADLQAGIEEAHRHGWIEPADLGWRLTPDGFAASTKLQHV